MKKFLEPFQGYGTYILLGILLALEIVLDRYAPGIKIPPGVKITIGFLPIFVAAYFAGPIGGMLVAGLGDFIGANLVPFGPYFPGYTLTAILSGAILGIILYKKANLLRIIIAVLITQIFCSLIINTYWISFQTGKMYLAFLPTRLMQTGFMIVAEIVIAGLMLRSLEREFGKK
ncbi:folate family ECF transporter S component [Treponema sp. R6D11]